MPGAEKRADAIDAIVQGCECRGDEGGSEYTCTCCAVAGLFRPVPVYEFETSIRPLQSYNEYPSYYMLY